MHFMVQFTVTLSWEIAYNTFQLTFKMWSMSKERAIGSDFNTQQKPFSRDQLKCCVCSIDLSFSWSQIDFVLYNCAALLLNQVQL